MKQTKKEAMKCSEMNNLSNLGEKKLALYNKVVDEIQHRYEIHNAPTYKEIKAKINKAMRQGRIYETEDRQAVFKYVSVMRYTVDMIAKYSGCRDKCKGSKGSSPTICVNDMYLYIRETEEVIHLNNHEWFNTDLCYLEVTKYYLQYGQIEGGIVFIPFLKGIKYAIAYKKDLPDDQVKYQIVTASKHSRTLFVQKCLAKAGKNYDYNYVRKHLAEL